MRKGPASVTLLIYPCRDALEESSIDSIGNKLTAWIVRLLDGGEGKLVLQKMSSTLAIFSLLPQADANTSLQTLLHACATKNPPNPTNTDLFHALSINQLTLGLWFCKNLAEEATYKISGYPSDVIAMTLSRVHKNLPDIVTLIKHCLTMHTSEEQPDALTKLHSEALSALLACALFVQKAWPSNDEVLSVLRQLIDPAISLCAVADSSEDAMDVMSDLLTNFGSFFGKEHLEKISTLLVSPWGVSQLESLWDEADLPPFAKFVLAFGDVTVKDIAYHPDSVVFQKIMSESPCFTM
jgi:hypothetical protein